MLTQTSATLNIEKTKEPKVLRRLGPGRWLVQGTSRQYAVDTERSFCPCQGWASMERKARRECRSTAHLQCRHLRAVAALTADEAAELAVAPVNVPILDPEDGDPFAGRPVPLSLDDEPSGVQCSRRVVDPDTGMICTIFN